MKQYLAFISLFIALAAPSIVFAGESGVAPNVISLPQGPGSVQGLGEEFAPSANSGTAAYGIAIEVPDGSGGLKPALRLSYDGGRGNSAAGFGWSMPLPRIQRQTDKGLPRYASTDTYIYNDATVSEELVPLADGSFRLKNEGAFIRARPSGDGWEVRTKSGVIYRLGQTTASRVRDPSGTKVFAWNISEMQDADGNLVSFEWISDKGQAYLSKVRYNDYGPDVACEISLSYEARADALADYRAGFSVTTALRVSRIEVRRGASLVRSYEIGYDPHSQLSRLAGVRPIGSDAVTSLPELSFGYTRFDPQDRPVVEMQNPPGQGPMSAGNALVDLNADGLPDFIVTKPGDHRYYINEDGVSWGGQLAMAQGPSYDLSQAGVRLADFNGDGVSDLVVALGAGGNKFLPGSGDASWLASESFDQNPVGFDPADPNTKFIDLNGDRLIDVLRTNPGSVSAWVNLGHGSFARLGPLPKIDPNEQILLSDPQIVLADFNGDGLLDVARLRSGSLVYWPSMGYGRFDAAVTMSGAPFTNEESRLRAADLNGDGLADILFIGIDHIGYWLNQGDGGFDSGQSISGIPSVNPLTTAVQLADMNGNGTTDIVWVDVSNGADGSWQYLDPIGDQYSGMLASIDNGLGKLVSIEYESSTAEMVRAARDGKPWTSTLPFPVQVIRRVSVDDSLGEKTISEFAYRDGFYDGAEREFRGFAGASRTEAGDASIEGLVTQWTFDTGRQYEALKGKPISETQLDDNGSNIKSVSNTWQPETLNKGTDGREVVFPALSAAVTSFVEGSSAPRYTREDFAYDDYGNVTFDKKHGEVASPSDDGSTPFGNDEIFVQRSYAINETTWILDRISRETVRDAKGNISSDTLSYYDGMPYAGLALGQVDRGNLMRVERWLDKENRYVQVTRNRYDAWGNITAIVDAAGGRREVAYDDADHVHPVKESIFTGQSTLEFQVQYDAIFGKPVASIDPNSSVTRYEYDSLGRLAKIVKPGDSSQLPTTEYSYELGAPISTITTRAREISGATGTLDSFKYMDGLGRSRAEATEDTGGGYVITKASLYNARGKESFISEPFRADSLPLDRGGAGWGWSIAQLASLSGTQLYYDAGGRTEKTVHPDGTSAKTIYLPLAQQDFDEDDADSSSSHAGTPTTKRYDGQARLVSVAYRDGSKELVTQFGYDAAGNIMSIVDPSGNRRTQAYDSLSRMVSLDEPNAGHRDYIYDDAGNLIEKRKPGGEGVKFRYEPTTHRPLGRNIYTGVDDDTWEVVYHYDDSSADWGSSNLRGRLAWVEDAAGKEYFSYDARGNAVAKRRAIGTNSYDLAFAYDAMDRQVRTTYPDNSSIDTAYNERGLIDSVGQYLTGRAYNAAGQVESELLGSGISRTYAYDARRRMTDQLAQAASHETIQQLHYGFDGVGNIMRIDDGRSVAAEKLNTQSFVYDDLYRLTQADPVGGSISWAYDDVGNITQRNNTLNEPRLQAAAIRYGENGAGPYAQTSADNVAYQYDANGRLINMPNRTLAWDAEDRLAFVTKDDGAVVTMIYGYDGNRVIKRSQASDATVAETLYIDPNYEVRGGKAYKYIWADGKRIARAEASSAQYALSSRACHSEAAPFHFLAEESSGFPVALLAILIPLPFARNPRRALALFLAISLSFCTWMGGVTGCGGNGPASLNTSASAQQGVVYYLTDHLGSAELVTDSNGNVLREEARYPYGLDRRIDNAGAVTADYVYTGKELDEETGLIYFGGRYYAPEMGRWTSPDLLFVESVKYNVERSNEINLYNYSSNNPESKIDVNGCIVFAAPVVIVGAFILAKAAAIGIAYVGTRLGMWGAEKAGGAPPSVEAVNESFEKIGLINATEAVALAGAATGPGAFAGAVTGGGFSGYSEYRKEGELNLNVMKSTFVGSATGYIASSGETPLGKIAIGTLAPMAGNLTTQLWKGTPAGQIDWRSVEISGMVGGGFSVIGCNIDSKFAPFANSKIYEALSATSLDLGMGLAETKLGESEGK